MSVPEGFQDFLNYDTDRCEFIQNYLLAHGVESAVIPIEGRRHIYVKFSPDSYNLKNRIKTVIAHYDRVENSPGANDNSSSVFAVMDFAVRLSRTGLCHNVRIFFTDGEEFGEGGVSGQGAFALASLLKKQGIQNDEVYVFDCMGRGTVPVLALSILPKNCDETFRQRFNELYENAKELLRSSARRWLNLPVSYSDNAGFLACGLPSVAVTMLPETEANEYLSKLQKNPELARLVMNHDAKDQMVLKSMLPMTWKLLHTEQDNIYSLTPESFDITAAILDRLAGTGGGKF